MVIVKAEKVALQVIAKAPPTVAVLRQEAEVATADSVSGTGTGTVEANKVALQVLAKVPPTAVVTRQEAEVATADSVSGTGTGTVEANKFAVGLLQKLLPTIAVLRQEVEVATEDTGTGGPVGVSKVALQILSKTPPPGPVPIALPDELAVMLHNWTEPFLLKSDFLTDVAASKVTGVQTRRAFRGKPARVISMAVLDHYEDLTFALTQLRRHTKEQMPVPLSCDVIPVEPSSDGQPELACVPAFRRFFPQGRVAVVQTCKGRIIPPVDRDIYQIKTVFADHLLLYTDLARTYDASWDVVPLIDCEKILETGIAWVTDQVTRGVIEFHEIVGASQLNQTAATVPAPFNWGVHHDGLPIFEPHQKSFLNWTDEMEARYKRPGEITPRARKVRVSPDGPREHQVQDYNFLLRREQFWDLLRFFDSRMGILLPFWEVDLENRWETVLADGTFIEVEPDDGDFELTFRIPVLDSGYLGIVMIGGEVHVRGIQTILETGGKWRCTLAGGEPDLVGIDLAQIARISVARQKQFSSDVLEEVWLTTEIVQTSLTTVESLDNKDIDLDP